MLCVSARDVWYYYNVASSTTTISSEEEQYDGCIYVLHAADSILQTDERGQADIDIMVDGGAYEKKLK